MTDAPNPLKNSLRLLGETLQRTTSLSCHGTVTRVVGTVVEVQGPALPVGALCRIETSGGPVLAEVAGFTSNGLMLLPMGPITGLAAGDRLDLISQVATIGVSPDLLGRVLDGLGRPLDGGPPLRAEAWRPLQAPPPPALSRRRIEEPMSTGVRALDTTLTLGKGQRIGLFAGSGVGKSTLLGMLASHGTADVNVVGLIGERGREVLEFLERDLTPEGRARTVVVVATSDCSAPERVRAALATTAIAEYFRDMGKDVCLMMDSLTRVAMAQREIGLATGEPTTTRGYTPSVFSVLPRLLERAGMGSVGSITGLYAVLVEGDDMMEPVADAARSILDGHVVLSRRMAERNHYPAIDVLASISRVMPLVTDESHRNLAGEARRILSLLESSRDLLEVGAYVAGTNRALDRALQLEPQLLDLLRQRSSDPTPLKEAVQRLSAILNPPAK